MFSLCGSEDSLEMVVRQDSLEQLEVELAQDLETVIAEATKLQTQVLQSIRGEPDQQELVQDPASLQAASELMELIEHRSEKETFSKGIASIIFEGRREESVETLMETTVAEVGVGEEDDDGLDDDTETLSDETAGTGTNSNIDIMLAVQRTRTDIIVCSH